MEELQDALEDARYVNAINVDEGPRPITSWEFPKEETLQAWKNLKKREWEKSPDKNGEEKPFSFEWVLSSQLGFFLFSSFLKESCNEHMQINFIEDLLRLRRFHVSGRRRGFKIRKIYERYLRKNREAMTQTLPEVTHIDEKDLEYFPPETKLSDGDLKALIQNHKGNANFNIGIWGPEFDSVVEMIVEKLNAVAVQNKSLRRTENHSKPESADTEAESSFSLIESTRIESMLDETALRGSIKNTESFKENENPVIRKIPASRSSALSTLPKDIFDKIELIVLENIRAKHWSHFISETMEWVKLLNYLWYKDRKIVEEDFFLMRVLGRGGFGLVTACKKGTTGKLYAMKVMNKVRVKGKKSEQLALNERAALAAVDSPFVISLKYSFQSNDDLILILDLMTGGDLSFHLREKGRFPLDECLYYAARIMLGLQALHDKNYVYRDLKPENCLLSDDGRVRITDLGLAAQVTPKLHGAAGTRGYWAPDMLRRNEKGRRKNYDQRVDWFSFGCLVTEMIAGQSPFRTEAAIKFGLEKEETKEKAVDYATLHMEPNLSSKKFSDTAADLCRRLLDKDQNKRLGKTGCEEIMAHPWFKDLNWDMIKCDKTKPPFVPLRDINAATQSEIGVFAQEKDPQKLEEKDQQFYKEWDYTNRKVFSEEVIEMLIHERKTGKPLVPLTAGATCCCSVM